MINLAVGLLIAALPFLVSGRFAAADFPPLLAYLLFPGRDLLLLLGGLVVLWSALRNRIDGEAFSRAFQAFAANRAFSLASLVFVAVIAFTRVPQPEKEADAFGGDEPKYLRIAFSLLRDTDADISGGRTVTPDFALRVRQIRHLALAGRDSFLELFRPVDVPEGHVWDAGNWTVRGLDGGLYHLQPPGLPALVAVALGVGEAVLPERDPGIYVFVLLAIVWTLGARELWLLSRELGLDSLGSAIFVSVVLLSAPVYVGGYQLFPESLCLLLFPWLFRRLRASDKELGSLSALWCGLVSGSLLWIHPKLTIPAALFATFALFRPQTPSRTRLLFAASFGFAVFTSLLYCHHISGLFRPEGLYIRQAAEYAGLPNPLSLRFMAGLIKALIGGRDGLFIFAPVLFLGFLGRLTSRWTARSTGELWLLFAIVWLTSAVHDGASLGSPARLMAPVAFVPALFLVRALRDSPKPELSAAFLLLFVVGLDITQTMSSDWRRNVNPYRTMFANPATNFEANLPGNSFSEEGYKVDLERAGLIFLTLLGVIAHLRSSKVRGSSEWAPARFAGGVLATVVILAAGLSWLGPP